jgi:hypothetical protein
MGLPTDNHTGMHNIKRHHDTRHQQRVKNVQEDLVPKQDTIIAPTELNYAEHGSNQDQDTGSVQSVHVRLPIVVSGSWCWRANDAEVEYAAGDDEDAEKDDLEEEADDD